MLRDSEKVEIFLHFFLPMEAIQRRHLNGKLQFPIGPRMRFIGKEMSINRFQRIEASWGYSGTPDRIKLVFIRLTETFSRPVGKLFDAVVTSKKALIFKSQVSIFFSFFATVFGACVTSII